MTYSLAQRLVAEFLGTALLVAAVVGSGIMASSLTQDIAVTLLANTFSTIFALGVLIFIFLPISGSQFNPVVTAVLTARKDMKIADAFFYVLVQIAGAILGAITANIMFGLPAVEFSDNDRINPGTFLGEVIATAGLIVIIVVSLKRSLTHLLPLLVPAWIGAAYFFTSSTSFANPAVTIGRMFTDTFTGIAPASVPLFIVAQILGAITGGLVGLFFLRSMTQQKVSS